MLLCAIIVACAGLAVIYAATAPAKLSKAEQKAFVEAHNVARRAVNVTDLAWNDTLSVSAGNYGSGCVFVHSKGNYGENLYAGYPANSNHTLLAGISVRMWVDEIKYADPPKWACMTSANRTTTCGHYTQVVWNTTASVGCAIIHCTGMVSNYVVCQYWPRGNYIGKRPY